MVILVNIDPGRVSHSLTVGSGYDKVQVYSKQVQPLVPVASLYKQVIYMYGTGLLECAFLKVAIIMIFQRCIHVCQILDDCQRVEDKDKSRVGALQRQTY